MVCDHPPCICRTAQQQQQPAYAGQRAPHICNLLQCRALYSAVPCQNALQGSILLLLKAMGGFLALLQYPVGCLSKRDRLLDLVIDVATCKRSWTMQRAPCSACSLEEAVHPAYCQAHQRPQLHSRLLYHVSHAPLHKQHAHCTQHATYICRPSVQAKRELNKEDAKATPHETLNHDSGSIEEMRPSNFTIHSQPTPCLERAQTGHRPPRHKMRRMCQNLRHIVLTHKTLSAGSRHSSHRTVCRLGSGFLPRRHLLRPRLGHGKSLLLTLLLLSLSLLTNLGHPWLQACTL